MSISDLQTRAERRLLPAVWDYLETGAGAERSLTEAESAWSAWRFRPRVLRDVTTVSTTCRLFGTDLATPVLVAPTAYHELYHPGAEVAMAAGVRAAGSIFCLSTRSSRPLERVADEGAWWMQVYLTGERDISEAMVDRAVDAGASALVLTGDTPFVPRRARGDGTVPLPEEATRANVQQHLNGRSWESLEQSRAVTTADIEVLRRRTGLPTLVKGVLRADDARACVEAGAAGIVVSNHGGRQLDRAVPTAYALPEVVDAVGHQVPVLVDGGVRTGLDVVTALALGADAVLVGRPAVYALACGGADGVAEMLRDLTAEIAEAMGLLGATDLAEIDRSHVTRYAPTLVE